MDLDLNGIKNSPRWNKNLSGLIELNGKRLTDAEVRKVIYRGLRGGFKTLHQIPDDLALMWIGEMSDSDALVKSKRTLFD